MTKAARKATHKPQRAIDEAKQESNNEALKLEKSKKEILLSIGAFKHLSNAALELIEGIAKLRHIQKDDILHYEGDVVDCAYLLVSGRVELYRMDKHDNELFIGYVDAKQSGFRLINTLGTFAPYEAASSVRGMENSEILLLDLAQLSHLVSQNIDISNAFVSLLMDKMASFKHFINFRESYDRTSYVAYMLYTDILRFNHTQRQVIARELNIKLETLSRILQKLQTQGLIDKDSRGNICINDRESFKSAFSNVLKRV